jgi:hypothetical protein
MATKLNDQARHERDTSIVNAAIEHYIKTGEGVRIADLMQVTGYSSGVVYRALEDYVMRSLRKEYRYERTASRDYSMFECGTTRRAYYFPLIETLRSMLISEREKHDKMVARITWPN